MGREGLEGGGSGVVVIRGLVEGKMVFWVLRLR